MNNFIIYSIEIGVCLALFYSAYWLFLKKETFFKLNRFYLIFSIAASLFVPLLNLSPATTNGEVSFVTKYLTKPIEQYEQSISSNFNANYLEEKNQLNDSKKSKYYKGNLIPNEESETISESNLTQTLSSAPSESTHFNGKLNWISIALIVYFAGVALFFIRFLANIIWILAYAITHKPQQISGMKVIRAEKNISPFSFLNLIVISKQDYPQTELDKIISHEKVHIQQKHSIDLILLELLLVFQWFNPFVWMYKRAVKINHEYLADHGTLDSGVDLPSYQYSLLNQVLRENNFEIASNYNLSIKKRIAMMLKKRSSKLSALKLTIALPILIFLFSAFAFSTKKEIDPNKPNELTINPDSLPKNVKVSKEYLNLVEGEYLSTNEPKRVRRIIFTEVLGTLFGYDDGYTYKLVALGDGKFTNPDDGASLIFDTKDRNAISLSLFGKINLNKVKFVAGSGNVQNRSMAFTLVKVIMKDGSASALAYYKMAKDSANYFYTENEMNWAGYELLQAGKANEAATLFKINVDKFPNSFNTYDSYAEALLAAGDKKGAIENYKKSLKLNPGSKSGIKHLNDLGVNTDELTKTVKLPLEYIRSLEGTYLSSNQPTWVRMIRFTEVGGVLVGQDNGYTYQILPMGDGKFINPDDGVSLEFNTKDKNAISFTIFGNVNMKKVVVSKEPAVNIANYAGKYLPAKKDSVLTSMEILNSNNNLFRYIESAPAENRTLELEFVTDNIFFYKDKSARSIEFIVNDKKEVTGCTLRRPDGIYTLSKKK